MEFRFFHEIMIDRTYHDTVIERKWGSENFIKLSPTEKMSPVNLVPLRKVGRWKFHDETTIYSCQFS